MLKKLKKGGEKMKGRKFCLITGESLRDGIVFGLIVFIYILLILLSGAKSIISAVVTSIIGMAMAYLIMIGSIYITDKFIMPKFTNNRKSDS